MGNHQTCMDVSWKVHTTTGCFDMLKIKEIATDFREHFLLTLKRFPMAFGYLFLFNAFIPAIIYEGITEESWMFIGLWGGSVGTILSLCLHLWNETHQPSLLKKRTVFWSIQIAHLTLTGILSQLVCDVTSPTVPIATAALTCAITVAFFVLPFRKQKDDLPHWNFLAACLKATGISTLTAFVLSAGSGLLYLTLYHLFDIDISDPFLSTLLSIACLFIAPTTLMSFLPSKDKLMDHSVTLCKPIIKFIHYVVLPILGIYILVLYLYAFKVLFTWELPRGWVSIPVTVSMAGMLLIEYVLHPSVHDDNHTINHTIIKWLPVVILPLLLFMTVGSVHRINDYGITIQRLYLIVFNLWCYAVCIGLIVHKSKRIAWIPTSFALTFCAVSCLPINLSNLTRFILHHEIHASLTEANISLPINITTYNTWLNSIEEKKGLGYAENMQSKFIYLYDTFGYESYKDLAEDFSLYGFNNNFDEDVQANATEDIEDNMIKTPATQYAIVLPDPYVFDFPENKHYKQLMSSGSLSGSSISYSINSTKDALVIQLTNPIENIQSLEYALPLNQFMTDEPNSKIAAPIVMHHALADLYLFQIQFLFHPETGEFSMNNASFVLLISQ